MLALKSDMIVSLMLWSIGIFVRAQGVDFSEIEGNLSIFNNVFPQEKVYLHLDNTAYARGEIIWFAAYVVRTDGVREDLSKTLYVELLNPVGEVFETQKLRIENGHAHGQISLDGKPVPTGFYEIRAYTRYMTNWPSECIFSRIFPVLSEIEGSISDSVRHYEMKNLESLNRMEWETTLDAEGRSLQEKLMQNLSYCDTLSQPNRTPYLGSTEIQDVRFYPEGGRLVRGIPSRIAFEVNEAATYSAPHYGTLCNEAGEVLAEVRTQHEGRGSFVCTPDGGQLHVRFGEKDFLLLEAEEEGCVMGVNALEEKTVTAEISVSKGYVGDTLGLSLMHNGTLKYFGVFFARDEPSYLRFNRSELPAGVNQLTLFTREGFILSERLFFVQPREEDVDSINVTVPDTIMPYGKIRLRLQGNTPKAYLSLSVQDHDRQLAPHDGGSLATWLLLASDLKGYIRNASYYLEEDDIEHRQAADLLMMVQGWRRYNWHQMAGKEPFEKKQPIEDGLYIDGQVCEKEQPVSEAHLAIFMIRPGRRPVVADAVTDSAGYYAIRLPDNMKGEWATAIQTTIKGKASKLAVGIDRYFSPEKKCLSLLETDMNRYAHELVFTPESLPFDSLRFLQEPGDRLLNEAVVKRRRKKKDFSLTGKDLEREKELLGTNYLYFDLAKEADSYADRGLHVPTLEEWVLQKDYVRKGVENGRVLMHWNMSAGLDFAPVDVDISASKYQMMTGEKLPPGVKATVPAGGVMPQTKTMSYPMQQPITAYRSAYIRMEPFDTIVTKNNTGVAIHMPKKQLQIETERFKNSIGLMVFQRHTFHEQRKGIRRTYYLGYNVPQTYEVPDYSILPLAQDYRRTLYWNPDVQLDDNGEAIVEFYNNSTCKSISISAEGITEDGIPLVNN